MHGNGHELTKSQAGSSVKKSRHSNYSVKSSNPTVTVLPSLSATSLGGLVEGLIRANSIKTYTEH